MRYHMHRTLSLLSLSLSLPPSPSPSFPPSSLPPSLPLSIQNFYTEINPETMELIHSILQTLIEMCVANFPNQEVIYNRQIIDVLNAILQMNIRVHCEQIFKVESRQVSV